MKWEIPSFNPLDYVRSNKSSRCISTDISQGTLTLTGSLDFDEVALGVSSSTWITFTNEGIKKLKINDFTIPSTNYGSIPSVLDVNDSFKLKITVTPKEIGNYSERVAFKLSNKTQYFTCTATIVFGDLRYDGAVLYDGQQTHKGRLVNV
jgi:hypothetical protein